MVAGGPILILYKLIFPFYVNIIMNRLTGQGAKKAKSQLNPLFILILYKLCISFACVQIESSAIQRTNSSITPFVYIDFILMTLRPLDINNFHELAAAHRKY